MKNDEIDVGGYDLAATLDKDRRRRAEAARSQGLGELSGLLLPLSVALARLTARSDFSEAACLCSAEVR